MPFQASDAKRHIKGLNPTQENAWARIANNVLKQCQGEGKSLEACEGQAIRVANARAKMVGKISKLDEAQRLVFGWSYVAKQRDGTQVIDHSGEFMDTTDLENAVYEFVEESREANDMHEGPITGKLVESFVSTPEKLEAMGLEKDALPQGVWMGFRLEPEAFERVRNQERTAFSIEGFATREAVE